MSSADCVVRPMRVSDLPFVSMTIRHDAHGGHYHSLYATDDRHLTNLIVSIGRGLEGATVILGGGQPHSLIGLTLECAEKPSGFAVFTTIEPDRPLTELWLMSIDPGQRYKGLGKRLLDGALAMPQIEKSPLLVRCNPPSAAMMSLLRHRGFQMLGTGPEGTHFIGRKIPQSVRMAFQRPH